MRKFYLQSVIFNGTPYKVLSTKKIDKKFIKEPPINDFKDNWFMNFQEMCEYHGRDPIKVEQELRKAGYSLFPWNFKDPEHKKGLKDVLFGNSLKVSDVKMIKTKYGNVTYKALSQKYAVKESYISEVVDRYGAANFEDLVTVGKSLFFRSNLSDPEYWEYEKTPHYIDTERYENAYIDEELSDEFREIAIVNRAQ